MNLTTLVAVVTGILGILGVLVRISWQMGRLVQRFGDHVQDASKIHVDQEQRLRTLEAGWRPPRPGRQR